MKSVPENAQPSKELSHQVPWSIESLTPPWTPSEGVEDQQLQQHRVQSLQRQTANALVVQSLAMLSSSVQFSHSVVSDSLWPHGLHHARLPCPSPTPRVYSNSCLSSQWCHPTISSSVIPFSSCLQSFQHQSLFQWVSFSHHVAKVLGVSASASVLPMNIQDWFPLGWTGQSSCQVPICSWHSAQFSSFQSLSHLQLFVTQWITTRQASLSIANSQSPAKLMSIKSVMPSSHLILCRPLLLLPSIRVFSNESTLPMRWPRYWSFSFNISPSNEHPGLIFRMDWSDLLAA